MSDHTALPTTHMFIHEWNEPYLPFIISEVTTLWRYTSTLIIIIITP